MTWAVKTPQARLVIWAIIISSLQPWRHIQIAVFVHRKERRSKKSTSSKYRSKILKRAQLRREESTGHGAVRSNALKTLLLVDSSVSIFDSFSCARADTTKKYIEENRTRPFSSDVCKMLWEHFDVHVGNFVNETSECKIFAAIKMLWREWGNKAIITREFPSFTHLSETTKETFLCYCCSLERNSLSRWHITWALAWTCEKFLLFSNSTSSSSILEV